MGRAWPLWTLLAIARAEEGVRPPWILTCMDSLTQMLKMLQAPLLEGPKAQVRRYYFFSLYPAVAMCQDPKLCSWGVFVVTEIGPSLAPAPEVSDPKQESTILLEVTLTVTPGGVVPPLWEVKLVHDLALMAGAGGAKPSTGATSTPVGGAKPSTMTSCCARRRLGPSPRPCLSSGVERLSSRWPGVL